LTSASGFEKRRSEDKIDIILRRQHEKLRDFSGWTFGHRFVDRQCEIGKMFSVMVLRF